MINGKNGSKSLSKPYHSENTHTMSKNLILHLPEPKGAARSAETEYGSWKLFVNENILDTIIIYTNEELSTSQAVFKRTKMYKAY